MTNTIITVIPTCHETAKGIYTELVRLGYMARLICHKSDCRWCKIVGSETSTDNAVDHEICIDVSRNHLSFRAPLPYLPPQTSFMVELVTLVESMDQNYYHSVRLDEFRLEEQLKEEIDAAMKNIS